MGPELETTGPRTETHKLKVKVCSGALEYLVDRECVTRPQVDDFWKEGPLEQAPDKVKDWLDKHPAGSRDWLDRTPSGPTDSDVDPMEEPLGAPPAQATPAQDEIMSDYSPSAPPSADMPPDPGETRKRARPASLDSSEPRGVSVPKGKRVDLAPPRVGNEGPAPPTAEVIPPRHAPKRPADSSTVRTSSRVKAIRKQDPAYPL